LLKKIEKVVILGLNSRKVYETANPHIAILGHFNHKRELLNSHQTSIPYTCYFRTITYLDVTPSILFFCIAETTTALKRCADMGAWMMWVCCQPVLFRIRR